MLTYLILFLVVSSGSLFISSLSGSRYEEGVPFSVFSIIAVLYLFGLANLLQAGVYFVCASAVALTAFTIYREIAKKQIKALIGRFFTPAFFIFAALAAAIAIVSYRRLITGWDEYSHWAYIVKAMARLNDFGTNPLAHALYFDYPPAMPLFQYFTIVLHGSFEEWLLYAVYLLAASSLFLPFLKHLTFKSILFNVLVCGFIVFIPTLFFMDYYVNLQIDKFLGLMFGFSMAILFLYTGTKNPLSRLTVLLSIFILVLLKPSGSLFAAFVLISFLFDVLHTSGFDALPGESSGVLRREKRRWSVASIGVFIFAVASWGCCVKLSNPTEMLGISSMSNTFHGISGESGEIIRAFLARMVEQIERFGFLKISDVTLLAAFFALLLLIALLYRGKDRTTFGGRTAILIAVAVDTLIYFGFVLLSYLTVFSTFDALRLASYDRYIGTILLSLIFIVFVAVLPLYFQLRSKKAKIAVLLASFFILAPFAYKRAPNLMLDKQNAVAEHEQYSSTTDTLKQEIGSLDASVYFIAQNTNGYEWLAFRYFMYPIHTYGYWSLGQPYSQEDVYTVSLDLYEWKQILEESYDYLYIYQCDEAFIEHYGGAFQRRDEIGSNRLYRFDPETKLLELICEINR